MRDKVIKLAVVGGWAAALVTGCSSIPSIGPDYAEPAFEVPDYLLPDAGQPTTNLTATGEYVPAGGTDDRRVVVSKDVVEQWWKRFRDPVLENLVEGGVSNNIGFLKAQKVLELNGEHSAFAALQKAYGEDKEKAAGLAKILLAQAKLIADIPLDDPAAYAELVCTLF